MSKPNRAPKPRCSWHTEYRERADGEETTPEDFDAIDRGEIETVVVREACSGKACLDWPVCRSHLRSWLNAYPLEAAKRRPPMWAKTRTGKRWAEDRGLAPGTWIEMAICAGPSGTKVHVVVSPDDALALADWYESQGQRDAASLLRGVALGTTSAVQPSTQQEMFA